MLLFYLSCFATGQNNGLYQKDSLQAVTEPDLQVTETILADSLAQLASTKQGEEKLSAIYDLVKFYAGTEKALHYMNMLEQEALRYGDDSFVGAAYMLKTMYYLELPNPDSLRWWGAISKEYSLQHKRYDRYFMVEGYLIQSYINNGDYKLAQFRIGQMLMKALEWRNIDGEMTAYEIMAMAYIAAKQPGEAIEPLKKAIGLLNKYAPDRKLFLNDYYLLLVQVLVESKNYTQALEYTAQWEQLLDNFDATKKGTEYENLSVDDQRIVMEANRSMCYTATGQTALSKQSLDKAAAFSQSQEIAAAFLQPFYHANVVYNRGQNNNQQAIAYLDKMIRFAMDNQQDVPWIDFQLIRSDILADMGQHEEAYNLRRQMNQRNDSLNTLLFPQQVQEIRTIYEVDKIEAEAKMKEVQYRNRLTLILTVAILSLLALAVIGYFYRKKQVAYRELVRKGQQWAEIIPPEDICTNPEEDEAVSPDESPGNGPDLSDVAVMEQVEQLMKEKKLYTNTELTLDTLSNTIGINRYYLSKAVNRCSGKSFTAYINEHRIKEAIRLMSDKKTNNLSIDGIAYESGFADRTNFYRVFKKMTGLPPATFRSNLQAN